MPGHKGVVALALGLIIIGRACAFSPMCPHAGIAGRRRCGVSPLSREGGRGVWTKGFGLLRVRLAHERTARAGKLRMAADELSGDWREFRARLLAQEQGMGVVKAEEEEEEDEEEGGGREDAWEVVRKRGERVRARVKANECENIVTWAHEVAVPETGCLLLARPSNPDDSSSGKFARQPYLRYSVIFVVKHDLKGSVGFILNQPTPYRLGKVTNKLPGMEKGRVYLGGDIGEGIQCLHGIGSIGASIQVREGVYMGVDPWHASELIEEGECSLEDFSFYYRCLSWGPGQLERECEAGLWYPAVSSPDVVLGAGGNPPGGQLWKEVMGLMGGRYLLMAQAAHGKL